VGGDFDQSASADSVGTFGIGGTATSDTPCFSAATLTPGWFPSGSLILGSLVSLEIRTNNGTVTLVGTVDPTGSLSGTYTVSGLATGSYYARLRNRSTDSTTPRQEWNTCRTYKRDK